MDDADAEDADWPEDDDHECWEYEDMDLLVGRACCRICGSARWLTSDQLRRELALQAELDAAPQETPHE